MNHHRFNLGTGMVIQLISYRKENQKSVPVPITPKQKDNSFISWKLIKVFAVIGICKIAVLVLLM
jgi:hypothetical protein